MRYDSALPADIGMPSLDFPFPLLSPVSRASQSHVRRESPSSLPSLMHSAPTTPADPDIAHTPSTNTGGLLGFFRKKRGANLSADQTNVHTTVLTVAPAGSHAAAASSPSSAAATAAPRRRWMRYPVRVPLLSLLLVSLLARTSEGWTSILGFLCGFLLFEGFSAPDTGQPNRIDTYVRRLIIALRRFRGRRRRARRKDAHTSKIKSIVLCFSFPFIWCFRRRAMQRPSPNNTEREEDAREGNDAGSAAPLLATEDDTDVLVDVAVSVTEDGDDGSAGPAAADTGVASTGRTTDAPLHPMSELTDSIVDSLPSLPIVSSLDPSDTSASSSSSSSVVGGSAHWAHMSISLRFTIYSFRVHIHHWVYLLIICAFLYMEQQYWSAHAASYPIYAFASAFCLGGSVQGLKYADWKNVIWRKSKEKKDHERRSSRAHVHNNNEHSSAASRPQSHDRGTDRNALPSNSSDDDTDPVARLVHAATGDALLSRMEAGERPFRLSPQPAVDTAMPPLLPLARANTNTSAAGSNK